MQPRLPKILKKRLTKEGILLPLFVVLVSLTFLNAYFWAPPQVFPTHTIFQVEEGQSLGEISARLEAEGLVKSSFWVKGFGILSGGSFNVQAGDYFFEKPADVFAVVGRLIRGDFNLNAVRITVPEGMNVEQTADHLASQFNLINRDEFIALAEEGKLFPDTYFFLPNIDARTAVNRMQSNFYIKMKDLLPEVEGSDMSFHEILTLASIIEEEANTPESRRMVSGILRNRLEIGMPLQVDASFAYVNGKGTYELTYSDLATDSPYNTYENTGLPPTPISNPGLDSILAAIEPEETEYLFFMHDLAGNIYYAEDFDGHQLNRERYLRR